MEENTIGQKIRNFRKRSGLSQFELETAIDASNGSISRIEQGKVNPTKETLITIAKELNLETKEIASLFGIDLSSESAVVDIIEEISGLENLTDVIDKISNDLIFKLGYLASMTWLIRGDKIFAAGLTNSNISRRVFEHIDKPFTEIYIDPELSPQNLTARVIKDQKPYVTHFTRDYTVPGVSKEVADSVQEATGDKSNIIMPLVFEGEAFGAIVFVKKIESDFENEIDMLKGIVNQLSRIIHSNYDQFRK